MVPQKSSSGFDWEIAYYALFAVISLAAGFGYPWLQSIAAMPAFTYIIASIAIVVLLVAWLVLKIFARITMNGSLGTIAGGTLVAFMALGLGISFLLIIAPPAVGFFSWLDEETKQGLLSPLGLLFFAVSIIQIAKGANIRGQQTEGHGQLPSLSMRLEDSANAAALKLWSAAIPGLFCLALLAYLYLPAHQARNAQAVGFGILALGVLMFYAFAPERWRNGQYIWVFAFGSILLSLAMMVAVLYFFAGMGAGQAMSFSLFITYAAIAVLRSAKYPRWYFEKYSLEG